jgi:Tfp pilus assembly protein PilF
MQSEVTRAIAREINVKLTAGESGRLAASHDVDPLAYEAYLRGRHLLREESGPAALDEAMRYFESAVRQDPKFALAYVAMSAVWNTRTRQGVVSSEEAFRMREPSIRRALELDSTDSEVRRLLAGVRSRQRDWAGAEREYRSALQADPNNAQALDQYAHFLVAQGRPAEATAYMVRAMELDPLNPGRHDTYGTLLAFQRRFDGALEHYRAGLRFAPRLATLHWNAAATLHELGRFTESFVELRTYFDIIGDRGVVSALDKGHAEGGYPVAVRRAADLLAERSRTAFVRPYWLFALYARVGETELALDWLERAVEERDPNMNNLRVLTHGHYLDHPRYKALLSRMGLDRDLPR